MAFQLGLNQLVLRLQLNVMLLLLLLLLKFDHLLILVLLVRKLLIELGLHQCDHLVTPRLFVHQLLEKYIVNPGQVLSHLCDH